MLLPPLDFPTPQNGREARAIQQALREKLRIENDFGTLDTVAGIDVGYNLKTGMSRASIVVMPFDTLEAAEQLVVEVPTAFPYIPGLLSFREIPAILAALAQLKSMPDLLMVDGQGIAHPRRMGIAAHLGVLLDMPAIGVAKSRLVGDYVEPGMEKGAATSLTDKDELIGTVLRSKDKVKPLFISPGHRVDVPTALAVTLRCLTRYRLPEPTRVADKFSKVIKT